MKGLISVLWLDFIEEWGMIGVLKEYMSEVYGKSFSRSTAEELD